MATTFLISHFTPTSLLYFLFLSFSLTTTPILCLNITDLLSTFPDFSDFNSLLSSSSLAADISRRSALTLIAVPNSYISSSTDLTRRISPSSRADILRYHVLLEYLSWSDLRRIGPSGKVVTTLLQTTGRATNNFGSVNITRDPLSGTISIRSPAPYSPSNATLLDVLKTVPYNVSIFSANSFIVPYGLDLMASETRPPLGLNITKALIDGHNFNVAASMLVASSVVEEFEADEGGAGITLFVPTDRAFADLPSNVRLQSLPADKKSVVLKFHVLHSYYPLGSLESIVNPVQPTLATEDMGAGSFTLNISKVNGSVAINTGIIQASVTQTVFDQNPVAIFGVSEVLLPKEIFGKNPIVTAKPGSTGTSVMGGAPSPEVSPSPEISSGVDGPQSHLSSPPAFRVEARSEGSSRGLQSLGFVLCCIGLYLLV